MRSQHHHRPKSIRRYSKVSEHGNCFGCGNRRCGPSQKLTADICRLRRGRFALTKQPMLLWREQLPADWLPKVLGNLPAVLVDHAHLERKAATTALNLEKQR